MVMVTLCNCVQASQKVFWSEPTFQDNVKIEAVIASALPGGELSLGKHVIVYQVSNFIIYLHYVFGFKYFSVT